MIKKNDILEIEIDHIGSDGEGIGHIDGYALFVKDAVIGDVVRVKVINAKKNYGYGRLMEVITPSKSRVEPVCPIARQCGGCQLQHYEYERQLAYKQDKVKNCLERIGKFHVVESETETQDRNTIMMDPIIGMDHPYYYRNKAQFPVGKDKENHVVTGFYASRTHHIIPTTKCYIQVEVNETLLQTITEFMEEYQISTYDEEQHKGLVRHILTRAGHKTGELMVCLIINGTKLPHADVLIERLSAIKGMTSICLNVNKEKTNVILGSKVICLWGQPYITDYIGDVKFQISPLSFFQVNPVQTEKLYSQALEYAGLTGTETVWDLYCGIGTISLFLAKQAKEVHGVEILPQAIEDAKNNAKINGITNAHFYVGAAEEVVPDKYKEQHILADVVMLDPPRKGCQESLLETIVKMQPKTVVYVSCDPATLARDLRYLADHGYRVERARTVDMFSHSAHVESVVRLVREQ